MRTERTAGVVRVGGMMAVATLVSRVTGFVAKVVIVAFLGFSVVNDAYSLANTLPNIIFELLLGGVLTSVAIPLLSRARSDPDGGAAYTQRLTTMMVVGLLGATGVAVAAAPLLTRLYLSSGSTADPALATHLAYLLLPQIFFYGVAALFGAILNTKEHFAAPAWAPVANNLVVIAIGALLLAMAGPGSRGGLTTLSRGEFLLLGAGTTAGIVVQAAVMLPALWRSGFRFGWRWGIDSRMREAGRLLGWAIGYALISQAGYVVTVQVSSHAHIGFYALYTYGSMLFQLPYGILGVSLLTAIMPRMSRHAADGEMPAVKRDVSLANRLSSVALVPVTAAMIALAVPLAVVTARYGAVDAAEVRILAWTLAAFAIGLLPLAITLVQMRVFYAMKDGRTPTVINAIMVAVRIPLLVGCLALPQEWIVPGLAGAMSVSYVVGVAVGEVWLRVRFGRMGFGATLDTIGRTALASAAGGLAAWGVATHVLAASSTTSLAGAIGQLVAGCVVGLAVTVAGLVLLRVREVDVLRSRLRSLLGDLVRRVQQQRSRGGNLLPGNLWSGRPGPGGRAARHRGPRHGRPGGTRGTLVGAGSAVAARSVGAPDGPPVDTVSTGPAPIQTAPMHAGPVNPGPVNPAPTDTEGQVPVTDEHTSAGGAPQPVGDEDEALTRVPHADPAQVAAQFAARFPTEGGRGPAHTPGTIVGERYRLTRLVATDAAGNEFWQARDTVLPRDMAITILPATDPTSATVTRTLRVGRLHHPSLPQTLDLGQVGSAAYVAGQWVDGATITDLLQDGPLEPGIATRLIAGVADALAEVHAADLSLGAVHPSLVRANFDGQVRLSHVVARSGAARDEDIRAMGALLYLMLTGTWPLAPGDGPAGCAPAPRRGETELPAGKVNASVPSVLSRLAERALHPEAAKGIAQVSDIAAVTRQFDADAGNRSTFGSPTGPAHPRTERAPRPPRSARLPRGGDPAATTPHAVLRDRRIKLSIAGGMLTAITVLIVIAAAAVTKQFLAGIVEPIEAADQQQLITVSVAPATHPATSTTSGASSGTATGTAPPTKPANVGSPIPISDAAVYDPQGTPPHDYSSQVDRAFDNNPATFWRTWVYKQQFGPNGIKTGVGLLLTFAGPVTPSSITVSTTTPGTAVEIRSATSANPALNATTVLGKATLGAQPVTIALQGAPQSPYLIVWITQLAQYQGTDPKNQGQFQSSIAEISVSGS
ncbi:MAG: murein biosynthesis integral membrane protein MurJ [Actinobacteria bacterium 69-20]|nr:MAG: murein biosynthesis integral membrane protein MurJ [Actinobacteria bacterium 69-20]